MTDTKLYAFTTDAMRATRATFDRIPAQWRLAALIGPALLLVAVVTLLVLRSPPATESAAPTASGIVLSPQQRVSGGITVAILRPVSLAQIYRAPGAVQTNDYTSGTVAPRVAATVISRSAKLGDRIVVGQKLVTLYSKDMAEAQSAFMLATRDLARFQSLTKFVAAREIDQALVKRQEALGRLISYGLTPEQIKALAARGLMNTTMGQFDLLAPKAGTITRDEFVVGQVIDPGKVLFEISDQRDVWVEAFVSPTLARRIAGTQALVIAGEEKRPARIVQIRETVDEATRTLGVRLQVENRDGALKPGQFVDVELYGAHQPVAAVPTAAVLRNENGTWAVYVENRDGSFSPRTVQPLFVTGDTTAISGTPFGTRVVVTGAFFVKSEGDKASFGGDE